MGLSVGVARACITPPLGASLAGYFDDRKAVDVHDDLHTRALVVSGDDEPIALVTCDLICCPRDVLDRAKELAYLRTGIPAEKITISCTHTHTGPATAGLLGAVREEAYDDWLAPRIADALQMAYRRRQPAVACWGVGSEPDEVHNRRWHMRDGSVVMNPPVGSPDLVRPAGPTDPEVGVLAFEQPDGTPIAAVVNYALHYVGGGSSLEVSADYFPLVEAELNRMAAAQFPVLMTNGFCGDINNINFRTPNPPRPSGDSWAQARHVARVLAAEALRVWEQSLRHTEARVAAASQEVPVPRRVSTQEELDRAAELTGVPPEESQLTLVRWWMEREKLLVAKLPEVLPTLVSAGRVGEVAWAAMPGEVFCDFGLAVKARSPFVQTMPVELANDYVGYICTPEAIEEGGYETWLARSSLPTGEGGWKLVDAALRLLDSLAAG
jgi:neutral ceramidase